MADSRKTVQIKSDPVGDVRIADEVVAIIAGLAATEVDGVSSMAGNITNEIVSKLGMKNLSKGIMIEIMDNEVKVDVAINIAYGYSIPEVSAKVQDKVKAAIENMTGLTVAVVNVRIASRYSLHRYDGRFPPPAPDSVRAPAPPHRQIGHRNAKPPHSKYSVAWTDAPPVLSDGHNSSLLHQLQSPQKFPLPWLRRQWYASKEYLYHR